jgi:hypothetical protein
MQFIKSMCSVVEVCAIINCMHGTLLGLYPRSVRTQTFPSRVQLAWRLREIMSMQVKMLFKVACVKRVTRVIPSV